MGNVDLKELKMQYGIVGRDEKLDRALDTALQVARTNLSVLIEGESGVGKEAIPKIIHDHSLRKGKPYIAINCGSIPEGTIDSELFGHTKGSFTGAIADHQGYFGTANGGTLFLDEVGELPVSTQVRLLRVLETGEYVSVGSSQPQKTDVRVVAATNVNMRRAINQGRFREDLYYRLSAIGIQMPPLRERGGDVLLLFKKFALDTARQYRIPEPLRLTPEAEAVITSCRWPGNIRQLKNVVERMSILCKDRTVTPQTLQIHGITPGSDSMELVAPTPPPGAATDESLQQTLTMMQYAIASLKQDVEMLKERLNMQGGAQQTAVVRQLAAPNDDMADHSFAPSEEVRPEEQEPGSADLATVERQMVERALKKNSSRKMAAKELGVSERTLYRKIKEYGLEE